MKIIAALLPLLLLCIFSFTSNAQNAPSTTLEDGGEYPAGKNDAGNPCITTQQYEAIEKQCAENIQLFGMAGAGQKTSMVTVLGWPLKAANGLSDCSFYNIAAYVDQNTNAGAFTDFNCGTRTYDGHKGTDIAITPFGFYKMDNDQVEVISAAGGIILDKGDGNFDRNCTANNIPANYIIIQHPDGSRALYWHLKKNSVTSKTIGQPVAAGEYLGVVGSSGSSSGPHLHFEVWSGSTADTRVDPYSGACNLLNANSWWASQKPYSEPSVIKVSAHTTDIVLPGCPDTEAPNESNSFQLPFQGPGLPPGAAKFYIFMRNETAGMTADVSILNPDGTVFNSWTHNSTNNYNTSWRSWTKNLPSIVGTYTLRATYNGITCSGTFEVTNVVTKTETLPEENPARVVPNPNTGIFTIEMSDRNGGMEWGSVEIYDLFGDRVYRSDEQSPIPVIDISAQPRGVYFASISSARGKQVLKVIKTSP